MSGVDCCGINVPLHAPMIAFWPFQIDKPQGAIAGLRALILFILPRPRWLPAVAL
jgi:hypothetical protein